MNVTSKVFLFNSQWISTVDWLKCWTIDVSLTQCVQACCYLNLPEILLKHDFCIKHKLSSSYLQYYIVHPAENKLLLFKHTTFRRPQEMNLCSWRLGKFWDGVKLSYSHPHAALRSFTGARAGLAGQAEIKLWKNLGSRVWNTRWASFLLCLRLSSHFQWQ